MTIGKRLLWGGLGWVLGGPIGAIIGYALASMSEPAGGAYTYPQGGAHARQPYPRTRPGDFMVSVLVLFASVMKADKKLLKAELDYIKQFLLSQFSREDVRDFMILFKDILKQNYPLRDVCSQIYRSMDHPSRLELIHVLFGLSQADGYIHPNEVDVIQRIARYLRINDSDFQSIKAMFVGNIEAAYRILGIDPNTTNEEVKKSYRRMANKYHPDKVAHLGEELRQLAEEKFKKVNEAYHTIKKERQMV